ncbi:MAG TPA: FG-GAP-like repeat-containing protein [Tepidisphaeraceae bacterium]|jgi:hypothetical protein|nr:FG-GAP-like repeat-containing protein [Tepidisphaeraceae bacterium]
MQKAIHYHANHGSMRRHFFRKFMKAARPLAGDAVGKVTSKPWLDLEPLENRMLLSAVVFQPQQTFASGVYPTSATVAELGNGEPDLVVCNLTAGTVSVLLGHGDGTFAAPQAYPVGDNPDALVVGDLGNGHPDIVVTNFQSNSLSVLLGNGDGTFQPAVSVPVGSGPDALALADLGDPHPDIVVANSNDNTVGILRGNGDGTFQAQTTLPTGAQPDSVAVASLGNGMPDILVTNRGNNTLGVYLGTGGDTFASAVTYATGNQPQSIAVGMFNSNMGVAVANVQDGTVGVFLGNGAGAFSSQQTYMVGTFPYDVLATSLGSGTIDLVVANEGDNTLGVLQGNGDGTFQAQTTFPTEAGPTSVAAADLGNAMIDLIASNSSSGSVSVLLQGTAETTTTLTSSANPSVAGSSVTFTAIVKAPVATPTGTVVFYDGTTELGSGVSLSDGSASISVSTLPIGSDLITADYSGDATNVASSTSLTQTVTQPSLNVSAHLSGAATTSVIAGTPLKLKDKLTLAPASAAISGNAMAKILLSPDQTASSSVATLSSLHARLKLKAGKSRAFALHFPRTLAGVAAGNYNVLVQLTDTTGAVSTINSGQTIMVIAARTDITGSFVKFTPPKKAGQKVIVTFLITNSTAANVPADGFLSYKIGETPDAQVADVVTVDSRKVHVNLKPGKSLRITRAEPIHQSSYLAVELDPGFVDFANDANQANNTFVATNAVTVPAT